MTHEELWEAFIALLNERKPLGKLGEHKSFIGPISEYKKLFLAANKETK